MNCNFPPHVLKNVFYSFWNCFFSIFNLLWVLSLHIGFCTLSWVQMFIIISNHVGLFKCTMNLCLQPFDEHQWQYFAEKRGVSTGMLGSPDSWPAIFHGVPSHPNFNKLKMKIDYKGLAIKLHWRFLFLMLFIYVNTTYTYVK